MLRLLILAIVLFPCLSYSQEPEQDQSYVSIDIQTFRRISTEITNSGASQLLKPWNVPGFSAGLDYSKIGDNGFTITSGLHYQFIPIGFRYSIKKEAFNVPSTWMADFEERLSDYSIGQLFIPLKAGYTFNKNMRWQPSVHLGANAIFLTSYLSEFFASFSDNQNNNYPVFFAQIYSLSEQSQSMAYL